MRLDHLRAACGACTASWPHEAYNHPTRIAECFGRREPEPPCRAKHQYSAAHALPCPPAAPSVKTAPPYWRSRDLPNRGGTRAAIAPNQPPWEGHAVWPWTPTGGRFGEQGWDLRYSSC